MEVDNKLTLDLWAYYTIKEWLKKINELGIDSSGALASSFVATVITSAGGNAEKIVFAFEYYGKMVDWGVGNGVPIELRDALISSGKTKRVRKEWFKQFYHELGVLKNLYVEKMELQVSNMISDSWAQQ